MINRLSIWWFQRSGWRFIGTLPRNKNKVILVLGPISSIRDLWLWMGVQTLTKYKSRIVIDASKLKLVHRPLIGFLRPLPFDSNRRKKSRAEIVNRINERRKTCLTFLLNSPHDSTTLDTKTFHEVAVRTESEVVLVAFDHLRKVIKIHTCFKPSGNFERDHSYTDSFFTNYYSYLNSNDFKQR